MKRLTLLLFLAVSFFSNYAQNKDLLQTNTIPDNLKKNADVVYRLEKIQCHIISEEKASIKYSYVITVLNQRGLSEVKLQIPNTSFAKSTKPQGAIYKADGSKFRNIKKDEVYNVSAISGYSLFEDSRVYLYEPPIKVTPFTLVYSYEETLNGCLFLPSWSAFQGYNNSVENSIFEVTVNKGLNFKYKECALVDPVEIKKEEDQTIYTWQISNLSAPKAEPASTAIAKQFPSVYIALNNFVFYDTKGSIENWNSFGQWITSLNAGKGELPQATIDQIKLLTKDAKSDREKIDIVYRYMQDKSHYVNIAIGIGGWQPIEASRVDQVCYGDCKALSNYTKSLLNVVGVKSHYVLISAGSRIPNFKPDFVSSQFNHAIVCALANQDTIWLECTNQKLPSGYISTFTDDRYALLVDGQNSKLIKTPALGITKNCEKRKTTVHIKDDFSAQIDVLAYYGGEYESEIGYCELDNQDNVRRYTLNNLAFANTKLNTFNYTKRSDINAIQENLSFTTPSIATQMGSRQILELNLMNKQEYIPKRVFKRRSDIEIQRSAMECDTVMFEIPEQYAVETAIKPVHLKSPFGSYDTNTSITGNTLTYVRTLKIKKGIYNKSLYTDYTSFFQNIKSADEQKVLLKKKL